MSSCSASRTPTSVRWSTASTPGGCSVSPSTAWPSCAPSSTWSSARGRAALPVIVVGDIDRGGVFASFHGTIALLNPLDQALISGFVVNKFRGDPGLLAPGLRMLAGLTGRQCYGVLPWREGLALDIEDSLGLDCARG